MQDDDVPFKRWKFLNSLAMCKRKSWENEKCLLEYGSHSHFINEIYLCKEQCEQKLERLEDIKKREVARVEMNYNQEIDLLEKEYENRVSESVETLLIELEEKKRHLDTDITALDISRWDGSFGSSDSNWSAHGNQSGNQWINSQQITSQGMLVKKQLRRRPNEMSNSSTNASSSVITKTDQSNSGGTNYSEKKSRKRSPGAAHIPLITQTLLPAQAIADDVEKLCPLTIDRHQSSSCWSSKNAVNSVSTLTGVDLSNGNNADNYVEHRFGAIETRSMIRPTTDEVELHTKHRRLVYENSQMKKHPRRVVLEFGKLSLDSKTFHRGQNVFIKSSNTGWKSMQALVLQVNELTVQFRSSIPGDTRNVIATKEDLESGRVLVKKRY